MPWTKEVISKHKEEGISYLRMFCVLVFYYDFYDKGIDMSTALPHLQEFFKLINLKEKEKKSVEMLLNSSLLNVYNDDADQDTLSQLFKHQGNEQEDLKPIRHCLINNACCCSLTASRL